MDAPVQVQLGSNLCYERRPMKRLLVIVATLGFLSSVHANLYTGTFEVTITQINSHGREGPLVDEELSAIPVGTVFGGWYQYTSDTVDGTFYGFYGPLEGELSIPSPVGDFAGSPIRFNQQSFTHYLIVTNGLVSAFALTDSGRVDINMSLTSFSMTNNQPFISWQGTVDFSPPATVPDPGNSLSLLALALVIIAAVRRRFLNRELC